MNIIITIVDGYVWMGRVYAVRPVRKSVPVLLSLIVISAVTVVYISTADYLRVYLKTVRCFILKL